LGYISTRCRAWNGPGTPESPASRRAALSTPSKQSLDPTPAEGPDPYGNPDPEWLRIDWREHLRTIEIPTPESDYGPATSPDRPSETTRVQYVELGSGGGLDLIFIHGLSGCWQNWLEQLPHFSGSHRVVAMDLPGFGASPLPPWEITVERYAKLVRDLCAVLDVGDCAVIGNSMGGFVAAEAAIHGPAWFEKLVLVSAAGVSSSRLRREPTEMAGRFAVATSPLLLKFQERGLLRPKIRSWAFRPIFHRPEQLRRELLWEFFHNGAGKPGFLPALVALAGYDILDRLEEVEVPTLLVWGRYDHIVPPTDALEYGQRLRNSRTVIFDQTGHVPMAERPVRFHRVLKTFLEE
jgi:pimeloyl-ACP methyl ester carboxylesterase